MPPKRKRAASGAASKAGGQDPAESTSRPSSRDASGENNTASILEDSNDRKRGGTANMDPPAKRTRAGSGAAEKKITRKSSDASMKSQVSAKPSAMQMSIKTGNKVEMPIDSALQGSGEGGEAGTLRMEAPPKAGLVDPAGGYKTNAPPTDRSVRVYADGVFDLMHLGHMRQLQQAKTAFPDTTLIVGVTGDAETHKRKGLTVMSGKERAETVRHCRWVDEVIEDCPWVINMEFLDKHKIDFVAHDDIPYAATEGDDVYKAIKEKGKFLVTQRTEGVSTTGIITKIVRDYEQYIARQLKRGTSRQELNISWLKKNELDIKRHVNELRDSIKQNWTTTGQELGKEFRQFWQTSRPNSPAPSVAHSFRNGVAVASSSADSPGLRPTDRLTRTSSSDNRSGTPQRGRGSNMDFAAGYAMGLIGGVKGWMEGSRRRNLSDSRQQSPDDSDGGRSPVEERGRVF